MSKININKETFKILMKIADQENKYWADKKGFKEKQCKNSLHSCRVGILSEFAAKVHLNNVYSSSIISLKSYGLFERINSKSYRMKPDLKINIFNSEDKIKEFNIEIKGIKKGQQRGQVLTEHVDKYIKNNFSHVVFCEVDFKVNEENLEGEANIEIYLIDKLININNYPESKNKYYKNCRTHPNFIHLVKSYK